MTEESYDNNDINNFEDENEIIVQETEEEKPEKKFPDDYYEYDKDNALKVIKGLSEQIREAYKLGADFNPGRGFKKIFIAGMGGSGIAGDLIKEYLEKEEDNYEPVIRTIKSYNIPKSVDEDSLFIAISYSGNTEETLSAYKNAARTGCEAVLISSGGKLEELAGINKHYHIKVPKGLQPRMAIAYLFFPLLRIMENIGVINSKEREVHALVEAMRKQDLSRTAIALSEKLYNKITLIYTDEKHLPLAYRFKTQINENSKAPAFTHVFSELNHNELLSFKNRKTEMHAIMITSDDMHRRIIKRIELTKEVLQKSGVPVTEIGLKGEMLNKMFSCIHLGDLTSYYLALRYETDPTPVDLIEDFKKKLGPFLI